MKLLVRVAVVILPLMMVVGCSDKPKPAEPPKQLMDPPKGRPIPGGSNKPAATTQLVRPLMTNHGLPT